MGCRIVESVVTNYSLVFPQEFDDYAWEVESKGWFASAKLTFLEKQYQITFYDPVRLRQTVEDELQSESVFFEPNLVVVPAVTRENMEKAIDFLIQSGGVSSLSPE
jgi:hypothetical protein